MVISMYKLYINYNNDGDFVTDVSCKKSELKETCRDTAAVFAKMAAQVKDYHFGNNPWLKAAEDLPPLDRVGVNVEERQDNGKTRYCGYYEFEPIVKDGKYEMI